VVQHVAFGQAQRAPDGGQPVGFQRPAAARGGAAKASRCPGGGCAPGPRALLHHHRRAAALPPAASQAQQLPSVGWPAKGSSPKGVKMRTR
jgi:hypothetical protein